MKCPKCGSSKLTEATTGELPFITYMNRPIRCDNCGYVFTRSKVEGAEKP